MVITNERRNYASTTVATLVPVVIGIPVTVPLIITDFSTVTLSITYSRCRDITTNTTIPVPTLKHLLLYGTVLLIYTTIITLYFVITPRILSNALSTVTIVTTDIVTTYSNYSVVKH